MSPVADSIPRARSTRNTWRVAASELGPDGTLSPATLIGKAFEVASALTDRLHLAVGLEDFRVLSVVREGVELIVSTALEQEERGQLLLSAVIRRAVSGAPGPVVALGTLRFARMGPGWPPTPAAARMNEAGHRLAGHGLTPVEARFRVTAGPAALLDGAVLARVEESSLVSAQGFVGAPVEFEGFPALAQLAPVRRGQALGLKCSVVHADEARITVLSHLRDDDANMDVLCSLSSFRARSVPRIRIASREGRELAREIERLRGVRRDFDVS